MKRKSDTHEPPSVEYRVRYIRKLLASGAYTFRTSGKLARRWGIGAPMVRIHAAEARRQMRSADEARDDAALFQELIEEAIEMARDTGGTQGAKLILDAAEKVAKRGGVYKPEKIEHKVKATGGGLSKFLRPVERKAS